MMSTKINRQSQCVCLSGGPVCTVLYVHCVNDRIK